MKRKSKKIKNTAAAMTTVFFAILIGAVLFSCTEKNGSDPQPDGNKNSGSLRIITSILPQEYFVKRIAGELAEVSALVGPGKSPATYEPKPGQVSNLSTADVLFTIGVPFEQAFLPKIKQSLKTLRFVDTAAGIEKRMLEEHEHDHEEAEEHEEEGTPDPHLWLSPLLVKQQAAIIRDTLMEIDPENNDLYQSGYQQFAGDLDRLHQEIKQLLAPYNGMTLLVFHPSFGYFADEYGLEQRAVEIGGKSPSPADLEKVITAAKEEGVQTVFVQPEFPQKSAEAVADAIGGTVVVLNPLHPDYIENLRTIAGRIDEAFAGQITGGGAE